MTVSRRLASKVATTTFNTSAAENEVATLDVAAYGLEGSGYAVRATFWGDILNNTGGGDTALFKVKLDDGTAATLLTTPAVSLSASANRRQWRLVVDILSDASADSQRVSGVLHISDASAVTFSLGSTDGITLIGYGTATETTSNIISVDVTVTLGSSSANLEVTCKGGLLEALT